MITTHAEQNADHYNLVRTDPMYRMEGMFDVLREEMMMNQPVFPEPIHYDPVETGNDAILHLQKQIDNLKSLQRDYENRVNKHVDKSKGNFRDE